MKARAATAPPPAAPRAPSRSELKDAAVRAGLQPLEPGEHPPAIVVAAVIAGLLGLGNLIAFAAGAKVQGKTPSAPGTIAFCALMIVMSVGVWRVRYWAVLGFQALLALLILIFALLLLQASNLLAVAVSMAVVGFGGLLFFKMIRALSRIQMPEPPG